MSHPFRPPDHPVRSCSPRPAAFESFRVTPPRSSSFSRVARELSPRELRFVRDPGQAINELASARSSAGRILEELAPDAARSWTGAGLARGQVSKAQSSARPRIGERSAGEVAFAVVALVPDEEFALPAFVRPRHGAVHDVDRFAGGLGVDEPAGVDLAGEGDGEGLHYAQRSPRLNVTASNGRTLTGSLSFAHAMSTHSPPRSSNASSVRSVGSMSHRYATPSRA